MRDLYSKTVIISNAATDANERMGITDDDDVTTPEQRKELDQWREAYETVYTELVDQIRSELGSEPQKSAKPKR